MRAVCRGAALAVAATLAACASLAPQAPEPVTQYLLNVAPAASAPRVSRDVVIEVAPVKAWPGFDTPRIAYAREPNTLDYYAANRWVDTPAHMLTPLLVRALEQDGGFRVVAATGAAGVRADYRLDVELERLVQEFGKPPSEAVLALRVQLTDLKARRVVVAATVAEREPATSENAAGGTAAANVALRRALARIVEISIAATAVR